MIRGLVVSSRFRWWSTLVLLAVASAGAGDRDRDEVQPASDVAGFVARPHLEHLPPGTIFRSGRTPAGWSNLVLKSTPVLASGDLDTVSEAAHVTARRIRLSILADVDRDSSTTGYRLRRIGVGLAAPVVGRGEDGGDLIVEATNVGESSGEWSTKERIILASGSRELSRAEIAAATPTFALVRTPTTCLVGANHETVDVMYAVLVDPDSGRVRLIACRPAGGDRPAVARELDAPAVVESPLHVKAKSFAGIPVSWSFAMVDVPSGVERPSPAELDRLVGAKAVNLAEARTIEAAFRKQAASSARGTARAQASAR